MFMQRLRYTDKPVNCNSLTMYPYTLKEIDVCKYSMWDAGFDCINNCQPVYFLCTSISKTKEMTQRFNTILQLNSYKGCDLS